jgi:hypothetical protein
LGTVAISPSSLAGSGKRIALAQEFKAKPGPHKPHLKKKKKGKK